MARVRGFLVDLTPLRKSRDYFRLWLGGGLSTVGVNFVTVAVSLHVYDLSGSTVAVGMTGLAALIPLVALGLYGGSIVDAYDRRRVLVTAQVGLTLVGAALAALAVADQVSVGLLYGLVAAQSGLHGVLGPARRAVIHRLLPRDLLPSANALSTLSMGASLAIGPLAAGALIDAAGYGWAYSVEAVVMVAGLVTLAILPPLPPEGERRRAGLGSVLEGLAYLRARPTLGMTFLVDIFAMVLAFPHVLFPAIGALAIGGGAATVGILVGGMATGAVLGGLFSGRLGQVRRQGRAIVVAVALWGLFTALFGVIVAVAPGPGPGGAANWALWPATALMVAAGASDTVSAVFRMTILQVGTPDVLQGRLQGVFIVVVAGGPHLGSALLGALAGRTGEAAASIIGGLLCTALVIGTALLQRGLLAYDSMRVQ